MKGRAAPCASPIACTVAQMITRLHRLDKPERPMRPCWTWQHNKRQRDSDAGRSSRLDDRFSNHGTDDPLLSINSPRCFGN